MGRLLLVSIAAAVVAVALAGVALAQPRYEFKLGFKMLAVQIPEVVGDPLEDEHYNPANGDSLQRTTRGLMAWRKSDNWTAFTNGARTWINGPFGIQERGNDERFSWESDTAGSLPDLPKSPNPRRAVPLGESRVVVTQGKQVEITVLEVVRDAAGHVERISPATYHQLATNPYEEAVLIRLGIKYVAGPPGVPYASDRVGEYSCMQYDGASCTTYLGPLPDPPVDRGLLNVQEAKEGWIVALVGRDENFVLVFGRSGDERVQFALHKEPEPTPTAGPSR